MSDPAFLQVAVDAPVMQTFDYLPPEGVTATPGQRVRVPFRRGTQVGVVLAVARESAVASARLRRVLEVLDGSPLLDAGLLRLLNWASAYYQHPPGEVYAAALPALLRRGAGTPAGEPVWTLTDAGREAALAGGPARAKVQAALLRALLAAPWGLGAAELAAVAAGWRPAARALEDHGWAQSQRAELAALTGDAVTDRRPALNAAQRAAVDAVTAAAGGVFLLEGVTGSGKTEVYLHAVAAALARGRQALVLVPEISLTPQLVGRFRARFPGAEIAVLHSGLTDTQRLHAWERARGGHPGLVIGTRSAVFAPLPRAGLLVVDEEHDTSFKQQEGFRYSARDVAVWRAHDLGVPVVLGSATPSLETLANAQAGRYAHLRLPERPGGARHPAVHVVDLRRHPATDGLSAPLVEALRRHLAAGGQALFYLNRRGFAPALICPACGEAVECRRCDARMVLHRDAGRVVCHHCGGEGPVPAGCATCGGALYAVGQGTERVETALRALFPEHELVRVDRDTTRRRGELEEHLERIASGRARLLVGTKMLSKGHDFPGVTLVAVLDADQGLFGSDFRAAERLAQSFVQVTGRAGRADRPGEAWLQTLFPDHELLGVLLREGYAGFARRELEQRRSAGWPPYTYLAVLRAEAPGRAPVQAFLAAARGAAEGQGTDGVDVLGPAPAPMERRAGRYRGQLLLQAASRPRLQAFLAAWRPLLLELAEARHARWSLEVDPADLF